MQIIILATGLAYLSGFALGAYPVMKRESIGFVAAIKIIWIGEVVSIGVMEIAMNATDYYMGGMTVDSIFSAVFLIAMGAIRFFVYVLRQHRSLLFPFVMIFASLGAFASYGTIFPVFAAIFLGVFGFIMEERGFPVVTIVLGVILGPIIEFNTRTALMLSGGDWTTFLSTWPRIIFLAIIIFLVINEIRQGIKRQSMAKI